MERQVIFRDRQENTPDDMMNLQAFVQASIDRLLRHGISQGRHFAGFSVDKSGPSEVTVAPGFYFNDGKVYVRLSELVQDMFNYLPVVTRRKVTLVVAGLSQDIDPQARDFLIDVDNDTIEPQVVAMERQRSAQLSFVSGIESAAPVNPSIDATVIAVAHILLDTNGVVSIEAASDNIVPSVQKHATLLTELILWREQISQGVESLRSDVANLSARIPENLSQLLVQMASRIKELEASVRVPDTAIYSFVERFANSGDSDLGHEDYDARLASGLTFPGNAPTRAKIALLNPLEPKVKTVDDVTLPAWTDRLRLSTGKPDGELSINQYSVVTEETVRKHLTRDVTFYDFTGIFAHPSMRTNIDYISSRDFDPDDIDPAQLASYEQRLRQSPDPHLLEIDIEGEDDLDLLSWIYWLVKNGKRIVQTGGKWVTKQVTGDPYWDVVKTEEQVSGAGVGQTVLAPANGWVTHVAIPFSQVAATGDVQILVTECVNGKPDITRVLGRGSALVADLDTDAPVKIPVTPHYWEAGKLYAVVMMTTGNHFVRTVGDGGLYSQGELYYLTDTHRWATVQVAADLALGVHYAKFSATRVEVQMENIEQAGGISALRIMAAMHAPKGTQLLFEVQNGGVWRTLDEDDAQALAGFPVTCQFRAVFIGTYDLMPAIDLTQTVTEASRTQLAFTHVSIDHEPPTASDTIRVDCFVRGFDGDHHDLDCALVIGGSDEAPDATADWTDPTDPSKMRRSFTFNLGAPAAAYAIKLSGLTDSEGQYFSVVERWDSAF